MLENVENDKSLVLLHSHLGNTILWILSHKTNTLYVQNHLWLYWFEQILITASFQIIPVGDFGKPMNIIVL